MLNSIIDFFILSFNCNFLVLDIDEAAIEVGSIASGHENHRIHNETPSDTSGTHIPINTDLPPSEDDHLPVTENENQDQSLGINENSDEDHEIHTSIYEGSYPSSPKETINDHDQKIDNDPPVEEEQTWTHKERVKIRDEFIAYYERRAKIMQVPHSVVAKELVELITADPGINVSQQVGPYLKGQRAPSRPVVCEAIAAWINNEISERGKIDDEE